MIFFCNFSYICSLCTEITSFFCCCFYCNCNDCKHEIKKFFSSICQKEKQDNNDDLNKTTDININNIDGVSNKELPPPNSEDKIIKSQLNFDDKCNYERKKFFRSICQKKR